jgi:hypothetical protein
MDHPEDRAGHGWLHSAWHLFYGAIEPVATHCEAVCKSIRRWRTPVLREMIWRWVEYVDDTKELRAFGRNQFSGC